jgi:predicted metal-dependent hydrolase
LIEKWIGDMRGDWHSEYARELNEGLRLYAEGAYWETHAVLEEAWLRQHGIDRHFLAGLIQLAAAIYKTRGQCNPSAGRRIYARALAHLAWVPDTFRGIDVREMERGCMTALNDGRFMPGVSVADGKA